MTTYTRIGVLNLCILRALVIAGFVVWCGLSGAKEAPAVDLGDLWKAGALWGEKCALTTSPSEAKTQGKLLLSEVKRAKFATINLSSFTLMEYCSPRSVRMIVCNIAKKKIKYVPELDEIVAKLLKIINRYSGVSAKKTLDKDGYKRWEWHMPAGVIQFHLHQDPDYKPKENELSYLDYKLVLKMSPNADFQPINEYTDELNAKGAETVRIRRFPVVKNMWPQEKYPANRGGWAYSDFLAYRTSTFYRGIADKHVIEDVLAYIEKDRWGEKIHMHVRVQNSMSGKNVENALKYMAEHKPLSLYYMIKGSKNPFLEAIRQYNRKLKLGIKRLEKLMENDSETGDFEAYESNNKELVRLPDALNKLERNNDYAWEIMNRNLWGYLARENAEHVKMGSFVKSCIDAGYPVLWVRAWINMKEASHERNLEVGACAIVGYRPGSVLYVEYDRDGWIPEVKEMPLPLAYSFTINAYALKMNK